MHIRQQLRTKVKTLLETALSRPVYVNRTHVLQASDLPCAIVTTDSDSVEISANTGNDREIELTIRLYEKAFKDVDDLIDDLCVKVENAFINDTTINAQTLELNQTSIDIEDGDQPIAVATMSYTATFIAVNDPEQVI